MSDQDNGEFLNFDQFSHFFGQKISQNIVILGYLYEASCQEKVLANFSEEAPFRGPY